MSAIPSICAENMAPPTSVRLRVDDSTSLYELKMLFPDSDFSLATYEAVGEKQPKDANAPPNELHSTLTKLHDAYMAQETKFADLKAANKAMFYQAKKGKASAKTPESRASFVAETKMLKHAKKVLVALHKAEVEKIKTTVERMAKPMQEAMVSGAGKDAFGRLVFSPKTETLILTIAQSCLTTTRRRVSSSRPSQPTCRLDACAARKAEAPEN